MKLAKGKKEVTKAPAVKEEVKAPEKVLTPEEERNLKTKAKVEELLDGVKLTLEPEEKKEELLEVAENEDQPKSTDWLEEQVSKLSEENDGLKSEIEFLLKMIKNKDEKILELTKKSSYDKKYQYVQE